MTLSVTSHAFIEDQDLDKDNVENDENNGKLKCCRVTNKALTSSLENTNNVEQL